MANAILPSGEQQFSDADGKPYVGGKVYFYIPNTLTPRDTYQDADGTILNTNPVILDAAGRAVIWGAGVYRQILKDALNNTIWDKIVSYNDGISGDGLLPHWSQTYVDQYGGYPKGALLLKDDDSGYWFNTVEGNTTDPDGGSAVGWVSADPELELKLATATNPDDGANKVAFKSSATGGIARTVNDKLAELKTSADTSTPNQALAAGPVQLVGANTTAVKATISYALAGLYGSLANTGVESGSDTVDFELAAGGSLSGVPISGAGRSSLLNVTGDDARIANSEIVNSATTAASGRGIYINSAVNRTQTVGNKLSAKKYGLLSSDQHIGSHLVVVGNISIVDTDTPYNFNNPLGTLEGVVCVGNSGERSANDPATVGLALAFAGTKGAVASGNFLKNGYQDSLHTEDGHENVVLSSMVFRACRQTGGKSLATGAQGNKGGVPIWNALSFKSIPGNTNYGLYFPTDATNGQISGTICTSNVTVAFVNGYQFGDGFFLADNNTAQIVQEYDKNLSYAANEYVRHLSVNYKALGAVPAGHTPASNPSDWNPESPTSIAYTGAKYAKQFGTNASTCATTLAVGDLKAVFGKIVQRVKPTAILTQAASMSGAGPLLKGFAFEQTINHTGSGTEAFGIFDLPTNGYAHGRVTVLFSDTGNNFSYTADFRWDGTTLTIDRESVSRRGTVGVSATAYMDVSGTTLRIRINTSSAINDTRAYVDFDGIYYSRQA